MKKATKDKPVRDRMEPKGGQECKLFAEQATDCLLDYLYDDPKALVSDSALFLQEIKKIWQQHEINETAVWQELKERLDLSADLLERGIRARKGGRYRSTKLP